MRCRNEKIINNNRKGTWILILWAIWLGITIFILRYLGVIQFDSKNDINYMWVWLIAAFINVVMQEYLIRGYIFQIFKCRYNTIVAMIVSTLIFTALHGGAFEVGNSSSLTKTYIYYEFID